MNTNMTKATEQTPGGSTTSALAGGCLLLLVCFLNHSALFFVLAGGLVGVVVLSAIVAFLLTRRSASNPSVPFEAPSRPSDGIRGLERYDQSTEHFQDLLEPYSAELSKLYVRHATGELSSEALIYGIENIESVTKEAAEREQRIATTLANARRKRREIQDADDFVASLRAGRRTNPNHVQFCPGHTGGICNQPGPCAEQRDRQFIRQEKAHAEQVKAMQEAYKRPSNPGSLIVLGPGEYVRPLPLDGNPSPLGTVGCRGQRCSQWPECATSP